MGSCQSGFLLDESCVLESGKPKFQKALNVKRVFENQGHGASCHLVIEIIWMPELGPESKKKYINKI